MENKTTLVLGAGASMAYGFPSGSELLDDILNILFFKIKLSSVDSLNPNINLVVLGYCLWLRFHEADTSFTILDAIENVIEFRDIFKNSAPASIDDFIYRLVVSERLNKDRLAFIGKLCIVLAISRYEKQDDLMFSSFLPQIGHRYYEVSNNTRYGSFNRGWYSYLWRTLYQSKDIKEELKKLSIITFNYERSLEYFLIQNLSNMMHKTPDEIQDLMNSINIHHVYGQLGVLQEVNSQGDVNEYKPMLFKEIKSLGDAFNSHLSLYFQSGKVVRENNAEIEQKTEAFVKSPPASFTDDYKKLNDIASSIKTYHEGADENGAVLNELHNSDRIYFLGFGYHRQNMEYLGLEKCKNSTIYGTTKGIGKAASEKIQSDIAEKINDKRKIRIRLEDMLINELFESVAPLEKYELNQEIIRRP